MKLNVITLDGAEAGTIDLDEALFGLEPRADILHRVVRWQRAKAQAGTHSTLTRAEVSYSTKKIYRQKGTGGARHGSKKVSTFRHGGTAKGPHPHSHEHALPKQFRALGLRHALSAKAKAGELVILDNATWPKPRLQTSPRPFKNVVGSGFWLLMVQRLMATSPSPHVTSKVWTCCRPLARMSMTS